MPGIDGAMNAPMIASVASVAFELLGFEPAVEDRPRGAGEHLDRLAHVRARVFAARAPSCRRSSRSREARVQHVGRNLRERRFDHRRDALQHRFVLADTLAHRAC